MVLKREKQSKFLARPSSVKLKGTLVYTVENNIDCTYKTKKKQ